MGSGSGVAAVTCRRCLSLSGQNTHDPRRADPGVSLGRGRRGRRGRLPFGQEGGDQPGACPVAAHPLGGGPGGSRAQPSPERSQPKARAQAEGELRAPPLRRCRGTHLAGEGAEGPGGGSVWELPGGELGCTLRPALDRLWAQGPEARGWGVRGDGDLEGSLSRLPGSWPGGGALGGLALAREGPGHSSGGLQACAPALGLEGTSHRAGSGRCQRPPLASRAP